MKRTIKIDYDKEMKFKASVSNDLKFPVWYGLTDSDCIGKACIYLNNCLDSQGHPEYIAELQYSDGLIGCFKKH